jgi:Flp pilus assembly protein TadD
MSDAAPVGDALLYAESCRAEGRLMEAEATCRQILQARPNTPKAEHLLGIIAHQNGKISEAIEHVAARAAGRGFSRCPLRRRGRRSPGTSASTH